MSSVFQFLRHIFLFGVLVSVLTSSAVPVAIANPMESRANSHLFLDRAFRSMPTLTFHLARLEQHQEAPGQVLYKAFATLHDQNGQVWRAIAFNYVLPDGSHNFKLRLVGFPGSAVVDRTKPLRIKTALGQSFTAPDDSEHIAIDEGMEAIDVPSNVAQYDLGAIRALHRKTNALRLQGLIPLRLMLPLENGNVRFLILPNTVQEWQAVADH